jgi:hypothetical protein
MPSSLQLVARIVTFEAAAAVEASPQLFVMRLLPVVTCLQEVLNLFCQVLQLGSTFLIINSSTSKHQPLPKPW